MRVCISNGVPNIPRPALTLLNVTPFTAHYRYFWIRLRFYCYLNCNKNQCYRVSSFPCFIRVLAYSEHDVCVCVCEAAGSIKWNFDPYFGIFTPTYNQSGHNISAFQMEEDVNKYEAHEFLHRFYEPGRKNEGRKRTMKMVKWEKKPLHPQITETDTHTQKAIIMYICAAITSISLFSSSFFFW